MYSRQLPPSRNVYSISPSPEGSFNLNKLGVFFFRTEISSARRLVDSASESQKSEKVSGLKRSLSKFYTLQLDATKSILQFLLRPD